MVQRASERKENSVPKGDAAVVAVADDGSGFRSSFLKSERVEDDEDGWKA